MCDSVRTPLKKGEPAKRHQHRPDDKPSGDTHRIMFKDEIIHNWNKQCFGVRFVMFPEHQTQRPEPKTRYERLARKVQTPFREASIMIKDLRILMRTRRVIRQSIAQKDYNYYLQNVYSLLEEEDAVRLEIVPVSEREHMKMQTL
ncbi:hypothetical protein GGR57DRAFT_504951 [Xylariaceae sp. FL1272]|nr:hypothetical protein GGR57DRAFT_504951 [Xylariaceae sp. FL1272]